MAWRSASMPSVFGMKPEAPNSMQRRITAGSSLAETTTIGRPGYCARRYIRPEKPRTPGMRRSSKIRSTSPPRSRSSVTSSNVPASPIVGASEQAVDRLAQRAAEQRMIVGDHQMMEFSLAQWHAPVDRARARGARGTADSGRLRCYHRSARESTGRRLAVALSAILTGRPALSAQYWLPRHLGPRTASDIPCACRPWCRTR